MSWRPRARTAAEIMSYLEKETEEETESSSESSDNSSDESCEEVLITKATVLKATHQISFYKLPIWAKFPLSFLIAPGREVT